MKRRKLHPAQLSLLEKRQRWSDLPPDTRRMVAHRVAQLMIARLNLTPNPNAKEPPHASR